MHNCIMTKRKNYKLAGYSSCQQLFARSTILVAWAQKECLHNSSMFSGGHRQDAQKLHDEQKVHTSIRTDQILEQLKKETLTQIKKQINIVGAPRQLTDRQKIERDGDRNSFFKNCVAGSILKKPVSGLAPVDSLPRLKVCKIIFSFFLF